MIKTNFHVINFFDDITAYYFVGWKKYQPKKCLNTTAIDKVKSISRTMENALPYWESRNNENARVAE